MKALSPLYKKIALLCSLLIFSNPALGALHTPSGERILLIPENSIFSIPLLSEQELEKTIISIYEKAENVNRHIELPDSLKYCYIHFQKQRIDQSISSLKKDDYYTALYDFVTWLAQEIEQKRAPRPSNPAAPVASPCCDDDSEILKILGAIRTSIGTVLDSSCDDSILGILGNACVILGPNQTISGALSILLACCEATFTTLESLSSSFSVIQQVAIELESTVTTLNQIAIDLNNTLTTIDALVIELESTATTLTAIDILVTELFASQTTCCVNTLTTINAGFSGTFTAIAAISAQSTDLSGVYSVLGNVGNILGKNSSISGTLLSIYNTTVNDFNQTWTILAAIQSTSTTCCNNTLTTLAAIQNSINGTFTSLASDFSQTWTLLQDIDDDIHETWTILGDVGVILGAGATITGTLLDLFTSQTTCCNNTLTTLAAIEVTLEEILNAVNPPVTLVYVANNGDNNVSVINGNVITATINVGNAPEFVAFTPNANFAYVTNSADGTVSVINVATNIVTATVNVGGNPQGIAATPNSNFVYVVNVTSNNISVINTASNTITTTINVGTNPQSIAISPNGFFAYATNGGSNNVSVINTTNNTITATINVGTVPVSVAFTPDSNFAYVVNEFSNNVSVINTMNNTITTTISVSALPKAVAISPNGALAYVVNTGDSDVSVIDIATNMITTTIVVGASPQDVAFSPDGTLAYVTNENDGTVSVINVANATVITTIEVGTSPIGVATINTQRLQGIFDTIVSDFNQTWTILAACCNNNQSGFQQTWTILGDVGAILGAGATISGTLLDLYTSQTTCCNNTLTTLSAIQNSITNGFNGTFTAIAALSAQSTDLSGIYSTLGNAGTILGANSSISGTLLSIYNTTVNDFNQTWTILGNVGTFLGAGGTISGTLRDLYASQTTCCYNTLTSLSQILQDLSLFNVYVANNGGNSVSVLTAPTNSLEATVSVGSAPNSIAITPNGSFAYVVNNGNNTVSVVDTTYNTVVTTINIGSGAGTTAIAITPNGSFAYVVNESGTISVINTTSNTITATINIGAPLPVAIAITPNGSFAYVANSASGTVSVINTTSNTITATITVAPTDDLEAIAITPNGNFAYVANATNNTVAVINTTSNTVTATIPVETDPEAIAITPNGSFAYVANFGSNTVSVISTTSNTITATITVGTNPEGIAITPDGNYVYVANTSSETVSVINVHANQVVTTIPGFNAPVGIAINTVAAPEQIFSTLVSDFNQTWTILAACCSNNQSDFQQTWTQLQYLVNAQCPIVHFITAADIGTAGYTISSPGLYKLVADITFNPSSSESAAISITSSYVTLDLNCHLLSQSTAVNPSLFFVDGIDVLSGANFVTIKNGTIQYFDQNGINVLGTNNNITIDSILTNSCGAGGIVLNSVTEGLINNCTVINSLWSTIDLNGAIDITSGIKVKVSNCAINDNTTPTTSPGVFFSINGSSCDVKNIDMFNNTTAIGGFVIDTDVNNSSFSNIAVRNTTFVGTGGGTSSIFFLNTNAFNQWDKCYAFNNSASAVNGNILYAFNINNASACIFTNCKAIGNSASTCYGYNLNSNTGIKFIDCFSIANQATGTTGVAAGFTFIIQTNCSMLRCLANDNVCTSSSAYGLLMPTNLTPSSNCDFLDSEFTRNNGDSAAQSFGIADLNGPSTSNLYSRCRAYANGTIATNQLYLLPAASTFERLTSNMTGATGPWGSVGIING